MRYAQGQITKLAAVLVAAALDGFAEDRPQPGKPCPNRPQSPFSIVVSIPDRKLALLVDGRVLKVYDVAIGKSSTPTPQGKFVVINRIPHPTWYGPQGPVPPGKGNPIGTRWMGLSVAGYGIHGTNAPASIGHAASHGCIRMRQRDLEELFDLVEVGTPVEIQDTEIQSMDELLAKVF
jgi:lipoprotein-anchoring transpeptidase ErfK/SrfK